MNHRISSCSGISTAVAMLSFFHYNNIPMFFHQHCSKCHTYSTSSWDPKPSHMASPAPKRRRRTRVVQPSERGMKQRAHTILPREKPYRVNTALQSWFRPHTLPTSSVMHAAHAAHIGILHEIQGKGAKPARNAWDRDPYRPLMDHGKNVYARRRYYK